MSLSLHRFERFHFLTGCDAALYLSLLNIARLTLLEIKSVEMEFEEQTLIEQMT